MFNEEMESWVDSALDWFMWACAAFGLVCFMVVLGYMFGVING